MINGLKGIITKTKEIKEAKKKSPNFPNKQNGDKREIENKASNSYKKLERSSII